MPDITYLDYHQAPPEDQEWVLVENTISGYVLTQNVILEGKPTIVRVQEPIASLGDAVIAAQGVCQATGSPDIYIKGVAQDA